MRDRISKYRILFPKEYNAWSNMKQRCTNKKNPRYLDYGGRGIFYDPSWDSFLVFLSDMGTASKDLSLDRINNDLGYCKSNCKWSTGKEQTNNQRIRKDNQSGYRGVYFRKNRNHWVAEFNTVYIGSFKSPLEASLAYENYITTNNT